MLFLAGNRLRHFEMAFEPFRSGRPIAQRCGSLINDMDTGETVSFICNHKAEGTALRIKIVDRVATLTLCEVAVFGKGINQ